jgi:hypothetical protein
LVDGEPVLDAPAPAVVPPESRGSVSLVEFCDDWFDD